MTKNEEILVSSVEVGDLFLKNRGRKMKLRLDVKKRLAENGFICTDTTFNEFKLTEKGRKFIEDACLRFKD